MDKDKLNLADLVLVDKATCFEKSKLNSYDSVAVAFVEFVPAAGETKEHMLCLPLTDRGRVIEDRDPFKVFLSDDAPSDAESVKKKAELADPGSCFILDRVSRAGGPEAGVDDLECGWINTVSKQNANTVLSGVSFIRNSEKEMDVTTGLSRIAMIIKEGSDKATAKTRPSVLTIFPQYAASLDGVDLEAIRGVMKSIIDKPFGTGQTNCVVRVLSDDGEGKLFEFSGMKDANNNYVDLTWESLKGVDYKQQQFARIIEGVEKFIADKPDNKIVLEIMPGLVHYPGLYTAKDLSALSNQATVDNYSLITGEEIKDRNKNMMPHVLNGGRASFVGVELGKHSVTKVIPINHNTYTNELGLSTNSLKGKSKKQITDDKKKKALKM